MPVSESAFGFVAAPAARGARAALDFLLPPLCMACREPVDAPGRLCADCWSGVDFIDEPLCDSCGLPFDYDIGSGAVCPSCAASPPRFARARAAMRYGETARRLAAGFKYADRCHLAPALASWLMRPGRALLAEADLLVPVPLHRWRLLARRFNQSAMLALALSRLCGAPAAPRALVRRRATPPQQGLSRRQRMKNVAGAFVAAPGAGVKGRRVVLIDDVYTTGATANACARALLRAGAARVDVLALARVVREV